MVLPGVEVSICPSERVYEHQCQVKFWLVTGYITGERAVELVLQSVWVLCRAPPTRLTQKTW